MNLATLLKPPQVFTEIGPAAIERGLADPFLSAFYEAMRSSGGVADARLRAHMPYLSLCSDTTASDAAPPIFYVGRHASQRRLFGEDWALQSRDVLRTPDPDLEAAAARGYQVALSGQPYYGYARTSVTLADGIYDVAFERLILALRPVPGAQRRFCAYFGVIQDLRRRSSLPG
ncbi:hypothetical protein [Polymorphum gilvum]|uniref:Uncharacterized protein n=1 Tax=Polymorphum gilvum (strain LMG 25793 / CGMCC 1.9160 / SL003B-26A1) TaxID=991905 RepID=F2IX97_POLGS|nr:hypothetical protein [Polymorphum gilvum]ADZ70415.1 hypothetical protein SL003B_1989 [Polymorphum gilvum SL003B-26A1]